MQEKIKKTGGIFGNKTFNKIHTIEELDFFLERQKKYFFDKYGMDYFSIHNIHHSNQCVLTLYCYDKWHETLQRMNLGVEDPDGIIARIVPTMTKHQMYVNYVETEKWDKPHQLELRADIFGERKYNNCSITMSDEENNKISYDFTFKDGRGLGNLDKDVLNDLISDLVRYRPLLSPFLQEMNEKGHLNDRDSMLRRTSVFKRENPSLFYF